jgi:SAM-dependent methyltransferase
MGQNMCILEYHSHDLVTLGHSPTLFKAPSRRFSLSEGSYEYRGWVAEYWDLLRGDTSAFPDRGFYKEIILSHPEPALLVGCGTGRLVLEYADAGIDIDGVDVSPEMIEICRVKAVDHSLAIDLYIQAMQDLDLPRRYGTVVVPSSSFQLVTNLEEAHRALARFHTHLLPGGTLVMSIMHHNEEISTDWSNWYLVAEKIRPEDGKMVRRWERSKYDATEQLRHTENRYELIDDGEIVDSGRYRMDPEFRDYSLDQITRMFETAGYLSVRAVSGFTNNPASARDEVFCVLGSKAV